jgi:hypothetical protein
MVVSILPQFPYYDDAHFSQGSGFTPCAVILCSQARAYPVPYVSRVLTRRIRVMVLTRNIWFGSLIGFAAGIIFLCALGLTICDQLIVDFTIRFPAAIHVVSTLGISLHLVNDLAISASLVWYLHRHRTGLQRSDALITDIIRRSYSTRFLYVLHHLIDGRMDFHSYSPNRHSDGHSCHLRPCVNGSGHCKFTSFSRCLLVHPSDTQQLNFARNNT